MTSRPLAVLLLLALCAPALAKPQCRVKQTLFDTATGERTRYP